MVATKRQTEDIFPPRVATGLVVTASPLFASLNTGAFEQDSRKRHQEHHEAGQRDALKGFLELPDLAVGGDVLDAVLAEGRGVEADEISGSGLGEVVPGVGLVRLVNDAVAAATL